MDSARSDELARRLSITGDQSNRGLFRLEFLPALITALSVLRQWFRADCGPIEMNSLSAVNSNKGYFFEYLCIAVICTAYIDNNKSTLGIQAKGRCIRGSKDGHYLRDGVRSKSIGKNHKY